MRVLLELRGRLAGRSITGYLFAVSITRSGHFDPCNSWSHDMAFWTPTGPYEKGWLTWVPPVEAGGRSWTGICDQVDGSEQNPREGGWVTVTERGSNRRWARRQEETKSCMSHSSVLPMPGTASSFGSLLLKLLHASKTTSWRPPCSENFSFATATAGWEVSLRSICPCGQAATPRPHLHVPASVPLPPGNHYLHRKTSTQVHD